MTKISVSSHICGVSHNITGRVEGNRIVIKIDTPCEKFRKHAYLEFPLHKPPHNQNNIVQEMEKQVNCSFECTRECALDCTRKCLIPSAVFDVCNIEKGISKKEIVKVEFLKTPVLSITECTEPESQ